MIVDIVSDLHGYYPELEGGDLLIVAGDLTGRDQMGQYLRFNQWLSAQDYTRKIVIAGNHDGLCEKGVKVEVSPGKLMLTTPVLAHNAVYLEDSEHIFEGLKIWGSPWTKTFEGMNPHCKAFTCDTEEELAEKWALIPDDIDILITHSPMLHMLDQNRDGCHCGSYTLRNAVDRVKPKLFIFGHIHECGGQQMMYKHQGPNTWCVNASYVDENYRPVNKPVRVIL